MYDQFYGFTGRPFQLTPDPSFYFESGTHRKAMSYLGYGLAQGEGIIVITGETGTGKTTLVGHLLNSIDASRLNAVKLVAAQVEGDDLLTLAAEQLGLDDQSDAPDELVQAMEIYLRGEARAGRRTLLIVDDVQNLSVPALEQLTRLSSLHLGEHPLLQIFLLGHPEFRHTLSHNPSLAPLLQRVIATHHLDAMEPEEVEPYIFHRLSKVGWSGVPSISADGFEALYEQSEGVPRRLNALMTKVLLFAALDELTRITGQHVRDVVAEVDTDHDRFAASPSAPAEAQEEPESEPVQAAMGDSDAPTAVCVIDAAEITALRDRVAQLEGRLTEQDAALRRVIDLLIGWVEPQSDREGDPDGPLETDEKAPMSADIWAA